MFKHEAPEVYDVPPSKRHSAHLTSSFAQHYIPQLSHSLKFALQSNLASRNIAEEFTE